MLTQAQILEEVDEQLGDVAAIADPADKMRWFNAGAARLGIYPHLEIPVTWALGDRKIAFANPGAIHTVTEILYPDSAKERRWRPVTGGLAISDHAGATEAGSAVVLARGLWPTVDGATPSQMTLVADNACVSYALFRCYRKITSNRSVYQRYSTLVGQNGATLDVLTSIADDHFRDYLDARGDHQDEPYAAYFPES